MKTNKLTDWQSETTTKSQLKQFKRTPWIQSQWKIICQTLFVLRGRGRNWQAILLPTSGWRTRKTVPRSVMILPVASPGPFAQAHHHLPAGWWTQHPALLLSLATHTLCGEQKAARTNLQEQVCLTNVNSLLFKTIKTIWFVFLS